jgi:hypothetical protein
MALLLCEYLPYDILIIIWENYTIDRDKLFLTKETYEENHKNIFDYYPKMREKRIFTNYCNVLAKNNCYYVIDLLFRDNFQLFYDPKKDVRLYYKECVYWSYLTYMRSIAFENKANKTYCILNNIIISKNKSDNRNKQISTKKKKTFNIKKYSREWNN